MARGGMCGAPRSCPFFVLLTVAGTTAYLRSNVTGVLSEKLVASFLILFAHLCSSVSSGADSVHQGLLKFLSTKITVRFSRPVAAATVSCRMTLSRAQLAISLPWISFILS